MAAKKNEQMYVGPEQPLLLTMNVVVVMDQETLMVLMIRMRMLVLMIDENCTHYHSLNKVIDNDDADENDDTNGGGERT